jgi:CRISPR-associated endonuclease/helicase Cas3
MGRARSYKRFDKAETRLGHEVNYYAHTAVRSDGTPERDTANWQLLSTHLRNVAELAKRFADPLGLGAEARLAGLLHDLGKYARRFQDRLHDNSIHGINHWAAGTAHAGETLKQLAVAFAVDGHHAGIPALDGSESLKQTVKRRAGQKAWQESEGQLPKSIAQPMKVKSAKRPFGPRSGQESPTLGAP